MKLRLLIPSIVLVAACHHDPGGPSPAAAGSAPDLPASAPPGPPPTPADLAFLGVKPGDDLGGFRVTAVDGIQDGGLAIHTESKSLKLTLTVHRYQDGAPPPALRVGELGIYYESHPRSDDVMSAVKALGDKLSSSGSAPPGLGPFKPAAQPM